MSNFSICENKMVLCSKALRFFNTSHIVVICAKLTSSWRLEHRYLLAQHLVLLLQRSQPPLQLFGLEVPGGIFAAAARQLALQSALGGDGFLQGQLGTEAGQFSTTLACTANCRPRC